MAPSPTNSKPIRPLSRPHGLVATLRVAGVVLLLAGLAGIATVWLVNPLAGTDMTLLRRIAGTGGGLAVACLGVAFYGLALIVHYSYHTALNIRAAERHQMTREGETTPEAKSGSPGFNDEVVSLLREINENALLTDQDKARKRVRMAETSRQRMLAEARQLIDATKWPAAKARIQDLRAEYPDDEEVRKLGRRLDEAMKEHQQIDIMTSSEQIRSYMSLGVWDKAHTAARELAEKYPNVPEAQKMQQVVDMEEQVGQKEDRLRLYREIEHLVARKHYREAKRAAELLVERHSESPEAAALRAQMDELTRNSDIEARREMEARIIEYTRQDRHREAYEVAKLLMEQYPDSPQAVALQDKMDQLRERANAS